MKKQKDEIFGDIDEKLSAIKKQSESIADFENLLRNAKKIDAKQRLLWTRIYKNAVEDRTNASLLFTNAYKMMGQSTTDHVAMGATLVKYMEKMANANKQLIELSDLIANSESGDSKIDVDDVFSQIEGKT